MTRSLIAILVVGVAVVAIQVLGAGEVGTANERTWLADLLSTVEKRQEESVERVASERREIIKSLLTVLQQRESEKNRRQIASAIRIAGLLRTEEVVGQLVEKINFLEYGAPLTWSLPDIRRDYVAVEALIAIGKASVTQVTERLSTERDPVVRASCVVVIEGVEGKEIGRAVLRLAAEKADGPKRKKLEEALNHPLLKSGDGSD